MVSALCFSFADDLKKERDSLVCVYLRLLRMIAAAEMTAMITPAGDCNVECGADVASVANTDNAKS